jgi:lipopolysaccharide/colanic/teichoic acid biosynthesis glycosyltransferase
MKRFLDILGSFVLIVILSPLFVFIALLIRLTSPGPVFFVQQRIGFKGRIFRILKFRTMVQNAERMGTGLYSYADDSRVTKVGQLLRKTSLDELPQLINVFFGSMSLVGPRPPVTYELGPWLEYTPHMLKRFTVKPGITGLAQVSGRNDLDWDEKIYYDNVYVDRFSKLGVLVDIQLLLMTIYVVLRGADTIEKSAILNIHHGSVSSRARIHGKITDSF